MGNGYGEDDLHRSHNGLNIPEGHKGLSITRAHDPMKCLKHHLKDHTTWYTIPQNDKRNQPDHFHSLKVYSQALKAAFMGGFDRRVAVVAASVTAAVPYEIQPADIVDGLWMGATLSLNSPPPPRVQRTLCPTNTSRSDRIFWGPN